MEIMVSSMCEKGKIRKINQDAIYYNYSKDWGLFVLCDGMGGHSEGERASKEVIEAMRHFALQMPVLCYLDTADILRSLKNTLSSCNDRINQETPEGMLCGCTVIVMLLLHDICLLLSMGDSRCYEIKKDGSQPELIQLTIDDIVGGEGENKNRLTNALGVSQPFYCRCKAVPLSGIRRYMICSDGVYKFSTPGQLKKALDPFEKDGLEACIRRIRENIETNGSKDNYSAILIWVDAFGSETDEKNGVT